MENFCEIKKLENNKWNFHFVYDNILDTQFDFTNSSRKWLSKNSQVLISGNSNTVELFIKKSEQGVVYVKWHQCSLDFDGQIKKTDNYYGYVL